MLSTAFARALVCLALSVFAAAGCQQAVLPQSDLRSGLTEAAVVELVGRKPERTERFKLKGRPDERYTVLEYYLAQTKTSPELRYWFLFDRSGLVGYGRGGSRVARGLAYDLFYQWLADHDLMPRAEAERMYLKQLQALYGKTLNPMVAEYSGIRAKTMALVDAKKVPLAKAEAMIRVDFSRGLGEAQRIAVYGQNAAEEVGRYSTMTRIGLDVSQAATISGRGAAGLRPLVSCERLRSEGAKGLRCF
jgi:hypothetical protein